MANIKIRKIKPNANANQTLEVSDWYGICSTTASTQTKTVSIAGFDSNSLQEGVRVVIRFAAAQTYNGVPKLNVSSTGAKSIQHKAGLNAGRHEWDAGSIISFVYYNGYWVIENGTHASSYTYGRTKLGCIDSVEDIAVSAIAAKVAFAGVSTEWEWDGSPYTGTTVLNTTTPSTWTTYDANHKTCDISYTDITSIVNANYTRLRCFLIVFGDMTMTCQIPWMDNEWTYSEKVWDENDLECRMLIGDTGVTIVAKNADAGEKTLKIVFFDLFGAGLVTYPLLKGLGYLTLDDLPVWDGGVQ